MVLDWISQKITRAGQILEQIGKNINESIARFERATGIDIPLVGTELPKPEPQPKPPEQKQEPPSPPESGELKTYRVVLPGKVHQQQIKEVLEQVGGRVVGTPEGVAIEFESRSPPKEVKITPYEEIAKRREEEQTKELASKLYEEASLPEKVALHFHTFMSGKGFDYVGAFLPGGKSPEDIVKEQLAEAIKKREQQAEYARETAIGALIGSVPGVLGISMLGGLGAGALVGKVGVKLATKVPQVTKISEFVMRHPTATKAVVGTAIGGVEAMKIATTYETLKAMEVPEEEIAEKIASEVARDVTAIVGFGYGFKRGLESTLPKHELEVIGRRTERIKTELVRGEEEGVPFGKTAMKTVKTDIWTEPEPIKDWKVAEAFRKGKTVVETPDYIIKRYRGYEYVFSKTPTGLKTIDTKGREFIDVLRIEKKGLIDVGVTDEGKYLGIEIYGRKGGAIPIIRDLPEEEVLTPTKPSKVHDVLEKFTSKLKNLFGKGKEITKVDQKVAKEMFPTEKVAKDIVPSKKEVIVFTPTEEVSTGGLKLITQTVKETIPSLTLPPGVMPATALFRITPVVPFVSPSLILPPVVTQFVKPSVKETIKTKEVLTPREVERIEEKVTEIFGEKEIEEVYTETFTDVFTDTTTKTITRYITETKVLEPTPVFETVPVPVPIVPPKLPSLPLGGFFDIGRRAPRRSLRQRTEYEPSLLGVLFGIKGRRKKGLFTGFEIRGL